MRPSLGVAGLFAAVCLAVQHASAGMPLQPEVSKLIQLLSSRNPNDKANAARRLGEMGPAAAPAVPSLIAALKDHTPLSEVHRISPGTGALKSGDGFGLGFTTGKGSSPAEEAARALGEIGDPRAVEPLVKLLPDSLSFSGIRSAAATALGKLGDAKAAEPLVDLLWRDGGDKQTRASAEAALLNLGKPAVQPLISLLKRRKGISSSVNKGRRGDDPRTTGRQKAAELLGKLGDDRAVDPLLIVASDPVDDKTVRENAAAALGNLGKAAVPSLIAQLKNQNERSRAESLKALRAITGQDFGFDTGKWANWWREAK